MRCSSIFSKGAITALTVLVISLLVATNFEAEQTGTDVTSESATTAEDDTMSVLQGEIKIDSGDSDTMSVMQGKVKVDPLGQKALADKEAKSQQKAAIKESLKHVEEQEKKVRTKGFAETAREVYAEELEKAHETGATSKTASAAELSLGDRIRQHLSSIRSKTSSPTMIVMVVMVVLIVLCMGVALLGMAYPKQRSDIANEEVTRPNSSQRQMLPSNRPSLGTTPLGTGKLLEQAEQLLAQGGKVPTPLNVSPAPSASMVMAGSRPGSHPVLSQSRIEHTFEAQAGSQQPGSQQFLMAPPLCSTLVMPVSEARFGVPMFELAEVKGEGEVTIVGLSGNPLLRGVVRRIGNARTLEIGMPEVNSAPRATITPSMQELAGDHSPGRRVLEIRGKRGSFYGTLEMRGSGACYVMRDGQAVLMIDGEAESLQLSIKSSVGLQLASVRCSAEPFGGMDHVEIRVEPGVDSVLVVAVVLAVLLLSDPNED